MQDRRRHPRFVLSNPPAATLRVVEEVVVESFEGRELSVITTEAAQAGEHLLVDRLGSGPPWRVGARVVESRPTVVNGALRHRLRLAVGAGGPRNGEPAVMTALARIVPVRVIEVSRSGCLLDAAMPVQVDLGGHVQIPGVSDLPGDQVRIRRCGPSPAGRFHVACEFTRTQGEMWSASLRWVEEVIGEVVPR